MGQEHFIHGLVLKQRFSKNFTTQKSSGLALNGSPGSVKLAFFGVSHCEVWASPAVSVARGAEQEAAAWCGSLPDCLLAVLSCSWASPGPNNSDLPPLCTPCNFTFPKGSHWPHASLLLCFPAPDPHITHAGLLHLVEPELSVYLLFFAEQLLAPGMFYRGGFACYLHHICGVSAGAHHSWDASCDVSCTITEKDRNCPESLQWR